MAQTEFTLKAALEFLQGRDGTYNHRPGTDFYACSVQASGLTPALRGFVRLRRDYVDCVFGALLDPILAASEKPDPLLPVHVLTLPLARIHALQWSPSGLQASECWVPSCEGCEALLLDPESRRQEYCPECRGADDREPNEDGHGFNTPRGEWPDQPTPEGL